MPYNKNDDNWAQQVPERRRRGPYEDYGWESRQSVLPEFRDPSVHRSAGEDWWTPGPYTGRGPRGYRRSDERIMEDVCQRLTQAGQLDASDIEVEVNGGEVTLKGNVDSRHSKRLAEDVAESAFGVIDVHNQLRVAGSTSDQGMNREKREGGMPGGGQGRVDKVGQSGIYPASGPLPPHQAEAQGMAFWGQGERGAAGYEDHGESET